VPARTKTLGQIVRETHAHRHADRHAVDHGRRRADPVQAQADRIRSSSAWQTFRTWFLGEHPTCATCGREGRVTPATEVDHVVPLRTMIERGDVARSLDESACEAICSPCHDEKSARERSGRA
jgi:5-methylcytosine-specific restriction protein A